MVHCCLLLHPTVRFCNSVFLAGIGGAGSNVARDYLSHLSGKPSEDEQYADDLPLMYSKWKSRITEQKFPSGLRWLHIDDKEATSVQWVVSVEAGFFDELVDHEFNEGTAHLLEHSIFLRLTSEQKSMFNFWNAYTSSRATVYQFETSHEVTQKSISLIAEHLMSYRKNPKSFEEVQAVNSE